MKNINTVFWFMDISCFSKNSTNSIKLLILRIQNSIGQEKIKHQSPVILIYEKEYVFEDLNLHKIINIFIMKTVFTSLNINGQIFNFDDQRQEDNLFIASGIKYIYFIVLFEEQSRSSRWQRASTRCSVVRVPFQSTVMGRCKNKCLFQN